jgi:hypothetical protein
MTNTVYGCRARKNGGHGIVSEDGWSEVRSSVVFDNGSSGIVVDDFSAVIDCRVIKHSREGIVLGSYSQAVGCSVTQTSDGPGIAVPQESIVYRCAVGSNTEGIVCSDNALVLDTIVFNSSNHGIRGIDPGIRVEGCLVRRSQGDGISLLDGSLIRDNVCSDHRDAAIVVEGMASRVDGNSLWDNGVGVRVVGQDNLIIGNDLASNATPFDIPYGNTRGPNGTMSGYVQSTNPYLNFNLTFP